MDANRVIAFDLVGVLFIVGTASGAFSVFFSGPLPVPDYLTSIHEHQPQAISAAWLLHHQPYVSVPMTIGVAPQ
jgi:hypothetical protein